MDNLQSTENQDVEGVDNDEADSAENFSIRESLERTFSPEDESKRVHDTPEEPVKADAEQESEAAPVANTSIQQEERVALVPPADMNAAEKDAFLNPTPANAHVLQQYMNRRAYETRSDYQRRVQEVEDLRKQTSEIYDTIKQYEVEYAKDGISLGDIAKRSVAWDKAMQENPIETAREWLESYGVSVQDLLQPSQSLFQRI